MVPLSLVHRPSQLSQRLLAFMQKRQTRGQRPPRLLRATCCRLFVASPRRSSAAGRDCEMRSMRPQDGGAQGEQAATGAFAPDCWQLDRKSHTQYGLRLILKQMGVSAFDACAGRRYRWTGFGGTTVTVFRRKAVLCRHWRRDGCALLPALGRRRSPSGIILNAVNVRVRSIIQPVSGDCR